MAIDMKKVKSRINQMISKVYGYPSDELIAELETGTAGVIDALYGARSEKWKEYIEQATGKVNVEKEANIYVGILKTILGEIEMGLVLDLRKEIEGEVFADFVVLAKRSLEENKDVSAVLACAALEDALKRLGVANGLNVENKQMSEVIAALKTKGLLKGAQAKVVSAHVTLRNKAFHAEWDKIEKPEVNSAIGFTEQFLLKHFG